MMLKDGGTYTVPPDLIEGYRGTYLNCDVMAELRAMAAWLESNPQKRKTRVGMPRFINAWLKRANDKGGSPGAGKDGGTSVVRTRDMTAMQDLTHNFTGDPAVSAYFTEKYGECFDERVQGYGRTVDAVGQVPASAVHRVGQEAMAGEQAADRAGHGPDEEHQPKQLDLRDVFGDPATPRG